MNRVHGLLTGIVNKEMKSLLILSESLQLDSRLTGVGNPLLDILLNIFKVIGLLRIIANKLV